MSTATTEVESKAAAKVREVAGATKARIAEEDAKSARRLRERQAKIELNRQETELKREQTAAKAAAKDTRKAAASQRRRTRRQARIQRFSAAVNRVHLFVAGNMPAVYSSCIYAMSLYVAVSGQISMAIDRGWPLVVGIGMAVFLEGLALSMALTAHQLRLRNERAFVPAAMTWVAAGFASAINVVAHRDDPVMAAVLGASSLAAIMVWEVRSGAKHRKVLRDKGWLPEPPERFGVRRWLRYPLETWAAWSLDVKQRVSAGAAVLIAQVQENRDTVTAAAAAEAALDSECAAETARLAAAESAQAAAQQAVEARAAAREAVQAVQRAARPARRLRLPRFRKNTAETPAPVPAAIETASRPDVAVSERPGTPAPARPSAAPAERPKTSARAETPPAGGSGMGAQDGTGRRTGSAKAEEDAELLERLKTKVPREPDGHVPVRRAMRELGSIGSGRATRLLKQAKLHKPARADELVSTTSGG